MALTPATDAAAYLRAQLSGEPRITVQLLPARPDDVITVSVAGGATQQLAMGMVLVSQEVQLQVFVRGGRARGREVEALVQSIHLELQALVDVTMNGTVYAMVTASGEPAYLGTDLEGRPLWSANYGMTRIEGP